MGRIVEPLTFNDLLGDPQQLSMAEFKSRLNNLLGYEKFTIEDGDEDNKIVLYTVERESHIAISRKSKGKRVFKNIRHYDKEALTPYMDIYDEIKSKLGKLDINKMDDSGCERLAARVLEEVFLDYKMGYAGSLSTMPGERKKGELQMASAREKIENGLGSSLLCSLSVDEICAGLEAQVRKARRLY